MDPARPTNSIAVLPFVNLSSDAEQEYFSDGLSDELLSNLAQGTDLRVTARTSSFAFKGSAKSIQEIARALGVAHVLEGSVRRAGNRLRITAQLINASDGYQLWSRTYNRDLGDVFAIQQEIAASVAGSLSATLGVAPRGSGLGGQRSPRPMLCTLQHAPTMHVGHVPTMRVAAITLIGPLSSTLILRPRGPTKRLRTRMHRALSLNAVRRSMRRPCEPHNARLSSNLIWDWRTGRWAMSGVSSGNWCGEKRNIAKRWLSASLRAESGGLLRIAARCRQH